MELAEGVILDGHYRLRQLLGRGGMGEVWEAEHTRLPKHLAIKFLHGLQRADPEIVMRFKREAEIASRLEHPSIVQVSDFNVLSDGTAYIVMERLVGEDLRARLERGPLDLSEAREVTRQVASALSLAHQAGIVHRDLKPENIFLCREPDGALRVKVLDFGISKLQQSAAGSVSTRDDRVLGTPGYMAPEQALGKNSSIDGRTDLFALATIVYEMLTGQGVFRGDTLAELCTKVLYHTPPPLDEVSASVPRSVAVAVSQALSKDPSLRQSEIRAFADEVVKERGAPRLHGPAAALAFTPTIAAAPVAPSDLTQTPASADAADAITRSARPSERSTSQPARPNHKRALVAAIAVGLAGVGAFVFLRGEPQATPLASTEAKVAELPTARVEPTPAVQEPATASPAVDAPSDAAASSAGSAPTSAVEAPASKNAATKGRAATGAEALSPSVRAALDDAERSLERGDPASALRLARASLREAESERAYFIMARAYCAQHDVGMLQAMLRNLSPARRKQVQRECAK